MRFSHRLILLWLAHAKLAKKKTGANRKHSRYRKDFFRSLSIEMLSIQASFPRVKDRFIYEERGERRIVMKMFVLLYNMRARMVGINQIRNTYMPHLNRNANEDIRL